MKWVGVQQIKTHEDAGREISFDDTGMFEANFPVDIGLLASMIFNATADMLNKPIEPFVCLSPNHKTNVKNIVTQKCKVWSKEERAETRELIATIAREINIEINRLY